MPRPAVTRCSGIYSRLRETRGRGALELRALRADGAPSTNAGVPGGFTQPTAAQGCASVDTRSRLRLELQRARESETRADARIRAVSLRGAAEIGAGELCVIAVRL